MWLLGNDLTWSAYDSAKPINFDPYAITTSGPLLPLMPVPIIPLPLDLTVFSGDGEIWVGYGLRNSADATVKDAYQDMINNQRYKKVWLIGESIPFSKFICLTATKMRVDESIGTFSVSPFLQR